MSDANLFDDDLDIPDDVFTGDEDEGDDDDLFGDEE